MPCGIAAGSPPATATRRLLHRPFSPDSPRMPPTPLSDYRSRVERAAAGIESLRGLALDAGLHDDAQALLLEVDRLRESAFRVVVIGEFSRGKSTLINALLGRPVLPARLRPTTSTLLRIRHGQRDSVTVTRADGTLSPWDLSRLAEVSTVTGDGAGGVREVIIELDGPFLAQGVELIDTPGVNDLSTLREDITLSYLPSADAAIFVLDAKACFTETERRFLTQQVLASNVTRVFFVVNKADQLDPPYNADDLTRLRERVHAMVRPYVAEAMVFALAAKPALDAAIAGDEHRRAESGLPDFLGALGRFLVDQRGATRVERSLRIAAARHDGIVGGLELRAGLLHERREDAASRRGEHVQRFQQTEAELQRMGVAWRERVEATLVPIREGIVAQAAHIQRGLVSGAVGDDSERHLRAAFVDLAERAMGQLRQGIVAAARSAVSDGQAAPTRGMLSPAPTAGGFDLASLQPTNPSGPLVTPGSTLTAAGVMGVAALLGIFSPGVIVFAGVMAFLHTRSHEERAGDPARTRSVELQAMVQEAARRLLVRLDEEGRTLAAAAWQELAHPALARLESQRAALVAAEEDLLRSDVERRRELDGLTALRLRLDATMRGLVDLAI